jgi:uncharacterized protein (TIGR03067 family)
LQRRAAHDAISRVLRLVLLAPALLAAVACDASCKRRDDGGPGGAARSTAASSAAASSLPGAMTLGDLQGRWRVRSSSGQPDRGHVFAALVHHILRVEGDRLSVDRSDADVDAVSMSVPTSKIITLLPGTRPQAIDLEQAPDAKGWSRVGIVELRGATMLLGVNFPGKPRPESMVPVDDGREVVVLERAP